MFSELLNQLVGAFSVFRHKRKQSSVNWNKNGRLTYQTSRKLS